MNRSKISFSPNLLSRRLVIIDISEKFVVKIKSVLKNDKKIIYLNENNNLTIFVYNMFN